MMPKNQFLPVLALIIWAELTYSLPNSSEELKKATSRLLDSSIPVIPDSVVPSEKAAKAETTSGPGCKNCGPENELPASPADLLRPGIMQFYTLNEHGQVVVKQMTKQEIQGMIAAGGGNLPVDLYQHQKTEEIPTSSDTKVSDVVQSVQDVLKGELNKPIKLMTSIPEIPGHVNSEWSNILPSILAGDVQASEDSSESIQDLNNVFPASDSITNTHYTYIVPINEGSNIPNQQNRPSNLPVHDSNTQSKNASKKPTTDSSTTKYELIESTSGMKPEDESSKNPPSISKWKDTYSPIWSEIGSVATKQNKTSYVTLTEVPHPLNAAEKTSDLDLSEHPGAVHYVDGLKRPESSEESDIAMIPVSMIPAEKLSTTTQHTEEYQTPLFQILSTISPIKTTKIKSEIKYPSTTIKYQNIDEQTTKPQIEVTYTTAALPTDSKTTTIIIPTSNKPIPSHDDAKNITSSTSSLSEDLMKIVPLFEQTDKPKINLSSTTAPVTSNPISTTPSKLDKPDENSTNDKETTIQFVPLQPIGSTSYTEIESYPSKYEAVELPDEPAIHLMETTTAKTTESTSTRMVTISTLQPNEYQTSDSYVVSTSKSDDAFTTKVYTTQSEEDSTTTKMPTQETSYTTTSNLGVTEDINAYEISTEDRYEPTTYRQELTTLTTKSQTTKQPTTVPQTPSTTIKDPTTVAITTSTMQPSSSTVKQISSTVKPISSPSKPIISSTKPISTTSKPISSTGKQSTVSEMTTDAPVKAQTNSEHNLPLVTDTTSSPPLIKIIQTDASDAIQNIKTTPSSTIEPVTKSTSQPLMQTTVTKKIEAKPTTMSSNENEHTEKPILANLGLKPSEKNNETETEKNSSSTTLHQILLEEKAETSTSTTSTPTAPQKISEELLTTIQYVVTETTTQKINANAVVSDTKYTTEPQVAPKEELHPDSQDIVDSKEEEHNTLQFSPKDDAPIIYLNIADSNSMRPLLFNESPDDKQNETFTPIKIKLTNPVADIPLNPVSEIYQILQNPLSIVSLPSVESLTLPNLENPFANNISSSLIAGFSQTPNQPPSGIFNLNLNLNAPTTGIFSSSNKLNNQTRGTYNTTHSAEEESTSTTQMPSTKKSEQLQLTEAVKETTTELNKEDNIAEFKVTQDNTENQTLKKDSVLTSTTIVPTTTLSPSTTKIPSDKLVTNSTDSVNTSTEKFVSTETTEKITTTTQSLPSSTDMKLLSTNYKTTTEINQEMPTKIQLTSLPIIQVYDISEETKGTTENILSTLSTNDNSSTKNNAIYTTPSSSSVTPDIDSKTSSSVSGEGSFTTFTYVSNVQETTTNKPTSSKRPYTKLHAYVASTHQQTTKRPLPSTTIQITSSKVPAAKRPVVTTEATTPKKPISTPTFTSTTRRPITLPYSTLSRKPGLEHIRHPSDKGRIDLEHELAEMAKLNLSGIPFNQAEMFKYNITQQMMFLNMTTESSPTTPQQLNSTPENIQSGVENKTTASNGDEQNKTPDDNSGKWTLIPQQNLSSNVSKTKSANTESATKAPYKNFADNQSIKQIIALNSSHSAIGLDQSVKSIDPDIVAYSNVCNDLAFKFWSAANIGLSTSRSLALSPFGAISMLGMIFLGARGLTSAQMDDILKLDDVVTFNPHLVFQNITDAVTLARHQGIENAAFVRALFADRLKIRRLMPFYKEQTQQFYEGFAAEVNFASIGDTVRRRTNLLIRKQTGGRIKDFVKASVIPVRSPLMALSANVFQTDCNCSEASSEGRDGEMYFAVARAVKQRKLVPIPAVVWKSGVLAGYEPSLDLTAIAIGEANKVVSIIFVLPGQHGQTAPGDNLDRLESRLLKNPFSDGTWQKVLKVIISRPGLELQIPKFSHRSVVNATSALKRMGFDQLFSKTADLKGINGVGNDLHIADVMQMNLFSMCGNENMSNSRHHVETYPGTSKNNRQWGERRYFASPARFSEPEIPDEVEPDLSYSNSNFDNKFGYESYGTSASGQEDDRRQFREFSEKPRLKLNRPFLYFVRHNPTGMILHMGRFNPK